MSDRKRPGVLRYLAFGLLGVALVWAIVTHSLVAALVRIEPSYALMLQPDDPLALAALAERAIELSRRTASSSTGPARFGFGGRPDPSEPQAARGGEAAVDADESARRKHELRNWASSILAQEIGNARALGILGELARAAGEEESAATLMRGAAQRSLREPAPHAWLISEGIKQKDWPLVMRQADILMRMHDQSIRPLSPLIAHLAESREASRFVQDALSEAPPWRTQFLADMLDAMTDARMPLELLLALKETAAPPTAEELQAYLRFLIHRRYFDLAYYTWLQFLPPQQLATAGLLFNGSFETRPSGLPFDWQLPREGTATVTVARRPGRPSDRALFVSLGYGRVELGATSQLLRLRPGRHRVSGEVAGEILGPRGLRWRIACIGERTRQIGESEMFVGQTTEWTSFAFMIDVPDADCTAQTLGLFLDARVPSERLATGSIWFDEMSISRDPPASVPEAQASAQSQPRQR